MPEYTELKITIQVDQSDSSKCSDKCEYFNNKWEKETGLTSCGLFPTWDDLEKRRRCPPCIDFAV